MAIPDPVLETADMWRWLRQGLVILLLAWSPLLVSAQCAGLTKWGDTPDSLVLRARDAKKSGQVLHAIELLKCALKEDADTLQRTESFLAVNFFRLGFYYSEVGYNQEALEAFQASLAHFQQQDSLSLEGHQKYADVLNALGVQYSRLAQFDKARVYCLQAVDSTLKYYGATNPDAIGVLTNTSNVLRPIDASAAFEVATWALSAAKQMKPMNPNVYLGVLGTLSDQFLDQGRLDSAQYYLALAQPHFSKASFDFQVELLRISADLQLRQGKVREGIAQFEQVIFMSDTSAAQSLRQRGRMHVNFADALKGAGRYDMALEYLQCALSNFIPKFTETAVSANPHEELWSMEPQLFEVFRHKAGCFAGNGNLDRAFETYTLAFRYLNYLRKGFNTSGARNLIGRFAFQFYEEPIRLAIKTHQSTRDRKYLDLAFQYMEQSKTNEVLESLQEMEQGNVDPEKVNRYRFLRSEVARMTDNPAANAEALSKLYRSIDTLYKELFPLTEAQRSAELETPASIQKRLESGHLFLEYFLGDSTLFVFVIDSSQYNCFMVPITPDFHLAMDKLMRSLRFDTGHSKGSWNRFAPYSRYLFRRLFSPLLTGEFKTKPSPMLTIIPDGRLALLPFECLLTSTKHTQNPFVDADYLGRYCAVRYGQSASTLKAQRHVIQERNLHDLLAVAASPDSAGALEAVEDEVRAAKEAIQESDLLLGSKATSENIRVAARNYRILHLACHAHADTLMPMHSWFALEGDNGGIDTLYAYEIPEDSLNSELVVLSACGTGVGMIQSGEGVMSLARSFQMAGCRTALMSLWDLDDKSTMELMAPFYERLAKGRPASEAMLHARNAYFGSERVANEPRYAHPHYWAAMVTVGENGPHLPQNEVPWTRYLIWGFITAFLIALWQRRRRRRKRKAAFAA